MKKITLEIILAIALIATLSFAQGTIKLIMVPEYIGGYSTIDLLNFVAGLKAKEDSKVIPKKTIINQPKAILQLVPPTTGVQSVPYLTPLQPSVKGNASA